MKNLYRFILLFLGTHFFVSAQTWVEHEVLSSSNVSDIYFVNEQVGFVLGSSGNWGIYRTQDAGDTWEFMANNYSYSKIDFLDSQRGFIGGSSGRILKTIDGGDTWTDIVASGSTMRFNDVQVLNDTLVYGLGYDPDDNYVVYMHKSTDFGETWENTGFINNNTMRAMHFINVDTGFVAAMGGAKLFRTNNGGDDWETIQFTSGAGVLDITQVNENLLVACGHDGKVFRSANLGEDWEEINTGIDEDFFRLDFIPGTLIGFAGGYEGKLIQTLDGGVTWSLMQDVGSSNIISGIAAIGPFYNWFITDGASSSSIWKFGDVTLNEEANHLIGSVYFDENLNCTFDDLDLKVPQIYLKAEPGPFYGITFDDGSYDLLLPPGDYTVKAIPPSDNGLHVEMYCPLEASGIDVSFPNWNETISDADFSLDADYCPYLKVAISSDFYRRCFTHNTSISYSNTGYAPETETQIIVEYPEFISNLSSSLPYTTNSLDQLVFDIGTLNPGENGIIQLVDSVHCETEELLGFTQCKTAWIYPLDDCIPDNGNWNKADLGILGTCLPDTDIVEFTIINNGTGVMTDSVAYRIYHNDILTDQDSLKIAPFDSLVLQVASLGQTVRCEVEQVLYHPNVTLISATVEACGDPDFEVSLGFFDDFPLPDQPAALDIECEQIIGSYDPNDKQGFPSGVSEAGFITAGSLIDYKIRFQNTGTDTAFTVVVVDTLSENLLIESLSFGASSHPYNVDLTGGANPILSFTFDNILLPDSSTNNLGSNGLVQFSIRTKADLLPGVIINNSAAIFFDFNSPIITNETQHEIWIPTNDYINIQTDLTQECDPNSSITPFEGFEPVQICNSNIIMLEAQEPEIGFGRWKVLSGNATISQPELATTLAENLNLGINTFVWEVIYCGEIQSAELEVESLSAPIPDIITLDDDVLQCSIEGETYIWYYESQQITFNEQSITAPSSGIYTVSVVIDGCPSVQSEEVLVVLSGVENSEKVAQYLQLLPTSNSKEIKISLSESQPFTKLHVFDIQGRILNTFTLQQTGTNFNIQLPNKGLFFGRLEAENNATPPLGFKISALH